MFAAKEKKNLTLVSVLQVFVVKEVENLLQKS